MADKPTRQAAIGVPGLDGGFLGVTREAAVESAMEVVRTWVVERHRKCQRTGTVGCVGFAAFSSIRRSRARL